MHEVTFLAMGILHSFRHAASPAGTRRRPLSKSVCRPSKRL